MPIREGLVLLVYIFSSEVGRGDIPRAKPKTYRLTPKIITSKLTPNSTAVTWVAVEKILLENETQKVIMANMTVMYHFFALEKFMGFSGSLGPSQPTICVMGSTHDNGLLEWGNVASMSFSESRLASRSGCDEEWTDAAGEWVVVFTAVSVGDSRVFWCSLKNSVEGRGEAIFYLRGE